MNCPKCQAPGALVEGSADGKTETVKCQKCGLNETRDKRGKPLLTEQLPTQPQQLLEG